MAWAAQALHAGNALRHRSPERLRQVLVIWLGQSNSRARMPAVNAVHSIGLKVGAGPVGTQIWLPGPPREADRGYPTRLAEYVRSQEGGCRSASLGHLPCRRSSVKQWSRAGVRHLP